MLGSFRDAVAGNHPYGFLVSLVIPWLEIIPTGVESIWLSRGWHSSLWVSILFSDPMAGDYPYKVSSLLSNPMANNHHFITMVVKSL